MLYGLCWFCTILSLICEIFTLGTDQWGAMEELKGKTNILRGGEEKASFSPEYWRGNMKFIYKMQRILGEEVYIFYGKIYRYPPFPNVNIDQYPLFRGYAPASSSQNIECWAVVDMQLCQHERNHVDVYIKNISRHISTCMFFLQMVL